MVFKIEDRGPVSSIKMSLDCKILTMMRTSLSVVSFCAHLIITYGDIVIDFE